ncbi:MAG: translation elongation factor Ts [Puniceicoccales bacterium]|jgi:elongation factor Ts|nr:translation elongation factor Ts [Puniceicoccales bacterium]
MANITAQQVNDLRARTGAGLMDCKKALVEANGDPEAAAEILRKKGAATRDKKAGRAANEGTIQTHIAADGRSAAIVEVNCESDFVGKNEHFQAFAKKLAEQVVATGTDADLAGQPLFDAPGKKVNDLLTEQITKTGENLVIARAKHVSAGAAGCIQSYIHLGGKIGVLVELAVTDAPNDAIRTLARQIAMHVAAAAPRYLTRDEVEADIIAKEREIAAAQAAGKPAAAIEKIVLGKLEKYYGETCLVDQPFVIDPGKTVSEAAKAHGASVASFVRFQIGQ